MRPTRIMRTAQAFHMRRAAPPHCPGNSAFERQTRRVKRALGIGLLCGVSFAATTSQAPSPKNDSGALRSSATLRSPGFHHLHLNVVDPEAEVAFYTRYFQTAGGGDVFGLPAIRTGRIWLAFTKVPASPKDQPQSAFWHFGWHVPDTPAY